MTVQEIRKRLTVFYPGNREIDWLCRVGEAAEEWALGRIAKDPGEERLLEALAVSGSRAGYSSKSAKADSLVSKIHDLLWNGREPRKIINSADHERINDLIWELHDLLRSEAH